MGSSATHAVPRSIHSLFQERQDGICAQGWRGGVTPKACFQHDAQASVNTVARPSRQRVKPFARRYHTFQAGPPWSGSFFAGR